ncbi:MAG: endonuclease [Chitinophagaceae bacterium]|nr:MAG: endonuclease [Chitinophagaceae bacterium]
MPEGPSLYLVKESLAPFVGRRISNASGNAKIDMALLRNKTIGELKLWGKQLFIFIKKGPVIRIHFLLFGSYSIHEQIKPDNRIRLSLETAKGIIYFYSCSVKLVDDPTDTYDWSADVLSDAFSVPAARKKLKAMPDTMVCDALLNQDIFSGVGNIIKNEVLYRIQLHPESLVGKLPAPVLTQLIKEARQYSFDFLEWKRAFVLKKNWLAHTKKLCRRCDLPFIKKHCGQSQRRSFFCERCQKLYN